MQIIRTEIMTDNFIMTKLLIAFALLPSIATVQSSGPYRGPIIDVHLHAHTRESLAQPAPNPATGEMSPASPQEHMTRSLAIMKERNVVLGIVSGSALADVEAWDAAAPDRIMKGISVDDRSRFIAPQVLDRLFREKKLVGSDQMRWPEAIALAIDRVNGLGFLTVEEKADIFYDNAAKFLDLTAEEIARHHR